MKKDLYSFNPFLNLRFYLLAEDRKPPFILLLKSGINVEARNILTEKTSFLNLKLKLKRYNYNDWTTDCVGFFYRQINASCTCTCVCVCVRLLSKIHNAAVESQVNLL